MDTAGTLESGLLGSRRGHGGITLPPPLNHGHAHDDNNNCDHGAGCDHGSGHVHFHARSHGHQSNVNIPQAQSPSHSLAQSMAWLRAHDPAECQSNGHIGDQCCDHSELRSTTNVIVMVRANELATMSLANTVFAIVALLYLGTNLVCTVLNSYDNECDLKDPDCSPATTPQFFHNLEFGATFIFNTIDLFALSYSPKRLSNQYQNPVLLKLVVLFNVGMSFCSFLLVVINLEKFEVLSHEMEYINELTIAIFDMTILLTLVRGRSTRERQLWQENRASLIILFVAGCVASVQLGIYNLSGWTADGDSKGEQTAHYLEFIFGIVSSGITFWFTMDNRMCADERLREIMYG